MVGTQDLTQEDPERDQRGKDAVQPAAERGQRLGDHFLRENLGERQVAVLKELAPEETRLGAKGPWVSMPHLLGLLAGKGWVGNLHPRKGGPSCLCHFGREACGDLRAI